MKTLINELLQMIIDSSLTFEEARPLISKTHQIISLINEASNESLSVRDNEAKQEKCCRCGRETTTNSNGICYGCKALEID